MAINVNFLLLTAVSAVDARLHCYDCRGPNYLDADGIPCNRLPDDRIMACYDTVPYCFAEATAFINPPLPSSDNRTAPANQSAPAFALKRGCLTSTADFGTANCVTFVDDQPLTSEMLTQIKDTNKTLQPQKKSMLCRCSGECCNSWVLRDFAILTQPVFLANPTVRIPGPACAGYFRPGGALNGTEIEPESRVSSSGNGAIDLVVLRFIFILILAATFVTTRT